jgi:hypothetical protein
MENGLMLSLNQPIDFENAEIIAILYNKTLKNIDNYTNYYAGNFNLIINNEKKISGPDLGGIFGKKSLENYKPYTYPSFMFHQDYSYRYEENSYTSYLFKVL